MRRRLNERGRLVNLREFERARSRDVDEDAACAVNRACLKQRRGHGCLSGLNGAVGAGANCGAHDCVAHASHGGFYVGKVAVDDAGDGDDVRDALHALAEHVIGDAETLKEAGVFGHCKELLVGDDDHGVDALQKLREPTLGLLQAALALKAKGARDHSYGQNAHLAGQGSDDRRGSGAGASTEAGGDEHHVGTFQRLDDLL